MATRRRKAAERLGLSGELWLTVGDKELGGSDRMGLLKAVAEQGSITQAAKAFGLSYKGAWDAMMAGEKPGGRLARRDSPRTGPATVGRPAGPSRRRRGWRRTGSAPRPRARGRQPGRAPAAAGSRRRGTRRGTHSS